MPVSPSARGFWLEKLAVRVRLLVTCETVLQAKVMAVLSSSGFVDSTGGQEGPVGLVLDTTNFYAEQGGQVADIGSLTSSSGHTFDVQDTQVSMPFRPLTWTGPFWAFDLGNAQSAEEQGGWAADTGRDTLSEVVMLSSDNSQSAEEQEGWAADSSRDTFFFRTPHLSSSM